MASTVTWRLFSSKSSTVLRPSAGDDTPSSTSDKVPLSLVEIDQRRLELQHRREVLPAAHQRDRAGSRHSRQDPSRSRRSITVAPRPLWSCPSMVSPAATSRSDMAASLDQAVRPLARARAGRARPTPGGGWCRGGPWSLPTRRLCRRSGPGEPCSASTPEEPSTPDQFQAVVSHQRPLRC